MLGVYLGAVGLSTAAIGWIFTAALAGGALMTVGITSVADRFGRRVLLVGGALLMAAAGAVFVFSQEPAWLALAAALGAMSPSGKEVGPFLALEQAVLPQTTDDRQRTAVFAAYNLIGSFAGAIGALAVGIPEIFSLDALAGEKRAVLGVALDEFQELHRLGGEQAEWHLRGTIQHHRNLSYVLAGSAQTMIRRMVEEGGAFYGMLDTLTFGPMDPEHFSRWLDERMEGGGVRPEGAGARAVALAGPRTRDVVQVARKAYDRARAWGVANTEVVDAALAELVEEQHDLILGRWGGLSPVQQNVLRAVAGATSGLTTRETLQQFGLRSSGTATNAAHALVEQGMLVKQDDAGPTGYGFDSPFVREWVRGRALADVGL